MKKILALLCAACVAGTTFVACGDDDDNGNGNGNGNGSVITSKIDNPLQNEGNLLLSAITGSDNLSFVYDKYLRPVECYYTDEDGEYNYEYKVDYDKGILWWDDDELNVSFTDKGYIKSLKGEGSETEDGCKYYYKTEQNYTYDKEGHILTASMEWTDKQEDGYDYYHSNLKQTLVYTWKNGNLISYTGTIIENWDYNGEITNETTNATHNFTYGSQPNKFKQYIELIDNEGGTMVSGIFGVYSENLPETFARTYKSISDRNGEYNDYIEYKGSFTLNPDGSINTEQWTEVDRNYSLTYNFHYISIDQIASMSKSYSAHKAATKSSSSKNMKDRISTLKNFPFMLKCSHSKFLK